MTILVFPVTPACINDIHHQQHHLSTDPKYFLTKITELLTLCKPNVIMPGKEIWGLSHFIFCGRGFLFCFFDCLMYYKTIKLGGEKIGWDLILIIKDFFKTKTTSISN